MPSSRRHRCIQGSGYVERVEIDQIVSVDIEHRHKVLHAVAVTFDHGRERPTIAGGLAWIPATVFLLTSVLSIEILSELPSARPYHLVRVLIPRSFTICDRVQFGIFTCPLMNMICALGGGESAMGGTLASVIGGAPRPRGVVWTTWLAGSARPCRRWSYIRSIPSMK